MVKGEGGVSWGFLERDSEGCQGGSIFLPRIVTIIYCVCATEMISLTNPPAVLLLCSPFFVRSGVRLG